MSSEDEFWEDGGLYRASDHPVVELFARQRTELLAALGFLDGVGSLLDVGAGSGFSSRYYAPSLRVIATDFADGMLRGNPVADRLRSTAGELPFADESLDIVSCWELLHHLEDPAGAIREMYRVARHRVILFEPNRIHPGQLLLAALRVEERRTFRFTPGHLKRLVRDAIGRDPDRHERGGALFANVTPLPIAQGLVRLPWRLGILGTSQLAILEKAGT